ncbi:hypothetical protein GZ405_004693 [Salmonella enterica]|uniref:Uncharacterized protein n=1 Tax=Salmonella hadar TaxID=149385 RepID=A0A727KFQ7_SALHA|nr:MULTISPECIES: hypothetical protein [Enterobacteriaceae]EAO1269931.1 hypothetical protein [Salmonella enterica]EBH9634719.1 hypothetical protein [Salmonella enterica subsp. enterica serovar Cerro]ECM3105169.1 hypothetical protein [Salmonella enterica subsp. enterica serovar Newport]ECM3752677.1 hypothetical protein [Salmonella enterica subsp. enterica serovar Montevideo]EKR1413423.1 hypothetical protein [Salmonella enterica subsp. enterica serovar Hadar]HDU2258676.1 hypothetical protein [Kl
MLKFLKKIYSYLEFLGALIWVGVGLYSIWLGFGKLFKDNSISIGGIEAVSLLDTTPFAIMFIFCGVLIITFIWVGYISKRLKNEA